MKIIENLLRKKYLEWEEFVQTIEEKALDIESQNKELRRQIKEENERIKKDMLKNMNFSG